MDGIIKGFSFTNGPTMCIGDSIYFKNRGGFRISEIYDYPLLDRPNCYFLKVIKIKYGEEEERKR